MDRRDFLKAASATAALSLFIPGCSLRFERAVPRKPDGSSPGPEETLLIKSVKIIDVITGSFLKETALVIKGGKIQALLSTEDAKQTKTARVIDGKGRYLIPGLINAHCHMTVPGVISPSPGVFLHAADQMDRNCVDCILHGVTTVRDQLGFQKSLQDRIERITRGELMGPRILRGIALETPGGYFDFHHLMFTGGVDIVKKKSDVRDAVRRAYEVQGADHIKVALQYHTIFKEMKPIPMLSDAELEETVNRAAEHGLSAALHHITLDGFRRGLKVGIKSLEHMPSDGLLTDEDVDTFINAGATAVPTMSVAWALIFKKTGDANFENPFVRELFDNKEKILPKMIREFAEPYIAAKALDILNTYLEPSFFDEDHFLPVMAVEPYTGGGAFGTANMMKLYRAGAKLGCGNDGGIPFIWPGMLPFEMVLNEMAGMAPPDVLKSATIVNAEILGMSDSIGSIEPGKIADLVFLGANPLESTANVSTVDGVITSGRLSYAGVIDRT